MSKEKRILSYEEGMTLEDMVNETNDYIDAVTSAFNATVQKQSELILGELNSFKTEVRNEFKVVKSDISDLKTDMAKLKAHFGIE